MSTCWNDQTWFLLTCLTSQLFCVRTVATSKKLTRQRNLWNHCTDNHISSAVTFLTRVVEWRALKLVFQFKQVLSQTSLCLPHPWVSILLRSYYVSLASIWVDLPERPTLQPLSTPVRNWQLTRDFHPRCLKRCWPVFHCKLFSVWFCMWDTTRFDEKCNKFVTKRVFRSISNFRLAQINFYEPRRSTYFA